MAKVIRTVNESTDEFVREFNKLMTSRAAWEVWADGWDKAIDAAINELEKMPAADVQGVKHGEWIVVGSSATQTHKAYRCSNCRRLQYYIPCDRPMYCSCCGAKMDGKGNNSDTV